MGILVLRSAALEQLQSAPAVGSEEASTSFWDQDYRVIELLLKLRKFTDVLTLTHAAIPNKYGRQNHWAGWGRTQRGLEGGGVFTEVRLEGGGAHVCRSIIG